MAKNRFLFLWLLVLSMVCRAQEISNDYNSNFAFNVHSIDEFFDRFDFKSNSAFEKFIRKEFPDVTFTRERMVYSLFNKRNTFLSKEGYVDEFVKQVADSFSPDYIYYSDKYWYAEIKCSVVFRSKLQSLLLTLKVEQPERNMFRWSVVSAKAEFLKNIAEATPTVSADSGFSAKSSSYFLSPVSHGIDFTNIHYFFGNSEHAKEYTYNGPATKELKNLISLIRTGKLVFRQIDSIKYHLLQIKGWIVSVGHFNRNSKNSGWLIDNLMKVTPAQKIIFLKDHLNVLL